MSDDDTNVKNLESPLEMTVEEYKDMIEQVAELAEEEAHQEWRWDRPESRLCQSVRIESAIHGQGRMELGLNR